jgi:hypothetical protein
MQGATILQLEATENRLYIVTVCRFGPAQSLRGVEQDASSVWQVLARNLKLNRRWPSLL